MIYNGTLTLYTRTTTIDVFGGEELTYTIGATVACNVQPASESITNYAGRIGIDATHVCFLPAGTVINTTMRVSYNSKTYQVTKIQDWTMGSGTSQHVEVWLALNTSPSEAGA